MTRRVGVIGCGWWGRNLVRNFAQLGALTAVADTDTQAATRASEEFKVPALDPDAMLARSDLEGVVIAAPAHAHAELALRALAAGKHVFVEKPLALRMEDAERVVEAARRHGRILMVGHLLQYHPVFLRLCELVSEGTLGRLQYVYSNRLNLGRIRREENVFWSFAPHDISMILRLVGETPDRVEASGACYLHNHIADVTNTWLSFPSGIHAHVFVSWLHPFKEQKLVVVGTEAMAVFDDQRPWTEKLQLFRHRISWHNGRPEPNKAEAEPVAVEPAEPLAMECGHFLECMATGASPRTDGEEGLKVLRVLTQAERSIARSRVAAVSAPASIEDGDGVFAHESAYVDEGCRIGERTRIWHFSHILKGSRIGRRCTIGQNVMIGPDAVVGDGCKIQNNVSVYKGVVLEDDVFCGPSAVFTNVLNPRAHVERKEEFRTTHVGKGATIGANATIVCGVRLGRYCLVGAGAVVTRDVPPHALVIGVPARQVGWVSHDGEQLDERLVCPRSGRRYHPDGSGGLAEIDGVEALSG